MSKDSKGTKGVGVRPTIQHCAQSGSAQFASGFYGQSVTAWQHKPTGPTSGWINNDHICAPARLIIYSMTNCWDQKHETSF